MATYESSGNLTTVEKSYSTPQTPDLSGLVYTLNGQSIAVDVIGSPGEAGEETQSVNLDGATSYDLSWGSSHTDFEVVFTLSTTDTSVTPEVDDVSLFVSDAPQNVRVTEVSDTPAVSLEWDDNPSESSYNIYRSTSPGTTLGDYSLIDSNAANDTTYTDTSVSLNTRYYYVVTAVNGGESGPSGEVRAEPNDDELTESIGWDSEVEWGYGEFTETTTDGAGNLELAELTGTLTYDYSLTTQTNVGQNLSTASVEIRDSNTSNVLASDSVSGDTDTTGSFQIDVGSHPDLDFEASVTSDSSGATNEALISGPVDAEPVITIVSASLSDAGSDTDTQSETYNYPTSGSWTSKYWDYTNVTTATTLSWSGVTYPQGGDDISVTVESQAGSTTQTSLSAGSGSTLVEVGADDQYRLDVSVSSASDDTTPSVDSLTLEAHTPTTGHTVTDTRETEQDLEWNEITVCDGYEVYQSESTPVTTNDTLVYSTTDSTDTTATITGLANGEQYYYNVRCIYSGE